MHSVFFNRLFQAILAAGADQEVLEGFKAEQDSILKDFPTEHRPLGFTL